MKKILAGALLTLPLSFNAMADFPSPYSNHSDIKLTNAAKKSIGTQSSSTIKIADADYTFYSPTLGDRDFGWTSGGWRHMGDDIWEGYDYREKNYNKPIYTVAEGIVISKSYGVTPFGYALVILHPKAGQNGKDIYSMYLHMKNDTILSNIQIGQYIGSNTKIGTIAATGSANNVSHLHLELRYFPEWYFPGATTRDIYTKTSEVSATAVAENWVSPRSYQVENNRYVNKKDIFWATKNLQKYLYYFSSTANTAESCKDLLIDAVKYYNYNILPFSVTTGSDTADYKVSYTKNLCRFKKSDAIVTFNSNTNEVKGLSKEAKYDSYWYKNTTSYANNIEFSKEEAVAYLVPDRKVT